MITPDVVRGARATLEEAVLEDGWPTLGQSRGKVIFLMDNGDPYRSRYLAGHPSLRGRVLFTNSEPGQPDAAFVKRNDAIADFADIQALVEQGYVVRTRADADTVEARTDDPTTRAGGAPQRRAVGQHRLPAQQQQRGVLDAVPREPAGARRGPVQPGQRTARLRERLAGRGLNHPSTGS